MPCRDQDIVEVSESYISDLKERNDYLARIACKVMNELVNAGAAGLLLLKDDEVCQWWKKHQEADRKARKEEERRLKIAEEQNRKKRIRDEVMSKLTPEEREALDIRIKKRT
jgi:hypothetical protein